LVEVDDYVGEDAEQVEGDEAQDRPVLGARGEKVGNLRLAAVVDGLKAAASRGVGGVHAVGDGVVSRGLVVEEGLGGGDVVVRVGGGHCDGLGSSTWM